MSVIADFAIPADAFPLGHLLEVRPGVQIRLESMVPTGDATIPYFWVESPDAPAVEDALHGSPMVEAIHTVDNIGDETLFRVDWSTEVDGLVGVLRETEAAVLDGTGHGDQWTFQLRFPGYDELSRFYSAVLERGIAIDLVGINGPIDGPSAPGTQLTQEQREALELGLQTGYFDVPRRTTLVDLGEELGISDSAVSQRIRRGLRTILASGIIDR